LRHTIGLKLELGSRNNYRVERIQDRECFIVGETVDQKNTDILQWDCPWEQPMQDDRCIELEEVAINLKTDFRRQSFCEIILTPICYLR
jgi:hypothetical protein